MNTKEIFVPERLIVGLCLAVAGGFLDAYTYILHGGVFANAQTGNIVLFGIFLAEGAWNYAFYVFMPILAFIVGIFATEWFSYYFHTIHHIHWRQIVLLIEMLLLFALGFLPLSVPDILVNTTIAFVCSVQVNSFRKLEGMAYSTTMCTGNLRSAVEYLSMAIVNHDSNLLRKSLRYWYIILAFTAGAALGAVLCGIFLQQAVWVCCLLFLFVLGYLYFCEEPHRPDSF